MIEASPRRLVSRGLRPPGTQRRLAAPRLPRVWCAGAAVASARGACRTAQPVTMAAAAEGANGAAAAAEPTAGAAAATGRRGPSGRLLRGPEQKTAAVEVPPSASANPLCTPAIEVANVRQVYDTIAEHWNHTRYKAWPRVDSFIRGLAPGSLVADLGCGNGKNVPAVREAGGFSVASDACAPLARIAAEEHGAAAVVADCLCTPFRSGTFDAALSIAVLHHLSSEPRRVQALREAARLLRPLGELLVYCWSYEQDDERSRSRHRFVAQDVLVPWNFRTPKLRKPTGSTAAGADGDVEAPGEHEAQWVEAPEVCQRYCHVYREGELLELLAQVPELEVVDSYFDTGNWCAVARRRPA